MTTTGTTTRTVRPELGRADFDTMTKGLGNRPTYLVALVACFLQLRDQPPTVGLLADFMVEEEGFAPPRAYGSAPEWYAGYVSRVGKALAKVAAGHTSASHTGIVALRADGFYAMTGRNVRAYATPEWVRSLQALQAAEGDRIRAAREAREAAAEARVITPAMAQALLANPHWGRIEGDSATYTAAMAVLRTIAAEAGA